MLSLLSPAAPNTPTAALPGPAGDAAGGRPADGEPGGFAAALHSAAQQQGQDGGTAGAGSAAPDTSRPAQASAPAPDDADASGRGAANTPNAADAADPGRARARAAIARADLDAQAAEQAATRAAARSNARTTAETATHVPAADTTADTTADATAGTTTDPLAALPPGADAAAAAWPGDPAAQPAGAASAGLPASAPAALPVPATGPATDSTVTGLATGAATDPAAAAAALAGTNTRPVAPPATGSTPVATVARSDAEPLATNLPTARGLPPPVAGAGPRAADPATGPTRRAGARAAPDGATGTPPAATGSAADAAARSAAGVANPASALESPAAATLPTTAGADTGTTDTGTADTATTDTRTPGTGHPATAAAGGALALPPGVDPATAAALAGNGLADAARRMSAPAPRPAAAAPLRSADTGSAGPGAKRVGLVGAPGADAVLAGPPGAPAGPTPNPGQRAARPGGALPGDAAAGTDHAAADRSAAPARAEAPAAGSTANAAPTPPTPRFAEQLQSLLAPAGTAAAERAPSAGQPPAVAHIPAPLTSPEFPPALGAQVSVFARQGLEQATIEINPPEMGPVSVQIALDGSAARIDFMADAAATRQVIEAALPTLASALRESGLTLAGGGVFQQPQQAGQGQAGHGGQGQPGRHGGRGHGGAEPLDGGVGTVLRMPAQRGLVDLVA